MYLTIVMAVYNKEKTIKRAIDSILKQKTKFSYKILVIDDCSKDGSVDIIRDYIKRYPEKIEFYQNKKNMRYLGTVLSACEKLDTPYWTLLDPDDYWISDSNIEDALSFLETNDEFSLYATNAKMMTNAGKDLGDASIQNSLSEYDVKRSAFCPYTHTSATFYRNLYKKQDIEQLKEFIGTDYEKAVEGDTFRNFWHLNKGKGHYLNIVKSVYEVDGNGIYTSLKEVEKDVVNLQLFFLCHLFFKSENKYDFLGMAHHYLAQIYTSLGYTTLSAKTKALVKDIVDAIDYKVYNEQHSNIPNSQTENFSIEKNSTNLNIQNSKPLNKKYYLFKFIEILRVTYGHKICRITLFGFIPLLKIRCYKDE